MMTRNRKRAGRGFTTDEWVKHHRRIVEKAKKREAKEKMEKEKEREFQESEKIKKDQTKVLRGDEILKQQQEMQKMDENENEEWSGMNELFGKGKWSKQDQNMTQTSVLCSVDLDRQVRNGQVQKLHVNHDWVEISATEDNLIGTDIEIMETAPDSESVEVQEIESVDVNGKLQIVNSKSN